MFAPPVLLPGSKDHDSALIAERCRRSFYQFIRHGWDEIVPEHYVDNWHIGAIAEHLQAITEGEINKLIINIPPGHAKSTLVSVMWPAWEWVIDPGIQSLFGAYSVDLALRDSVRCRTFFEGEWYQKTFQPSWRMLREQNAKGFYTNSCNGNRYTFALGARGKTGWRGDKVVVDDPNDVQARFNARVKADAFDTYNSVLSTRVNDLTKAKFVIIQQRVAYDDFTGRLTAEGGYELLMIPSEFKPSRRIFTKIGWTDPRKEEGELLFPKKFPKESLDYLRIFKLGEEGYSAQHGQDPFPEGGARFNRTDFLRWSRSGGSLIKFHRKNNVIDTYNFNLCWTFVTCDFAASEGTSSDWTVFATWGVTPSFDLFLINVDRARLTEPKIVEKALAIHSFVGYNGKRHLAFIVEDNGLGLPICQAMQEKGIPTLSVHIHRTDKLVRSTTAVVRAQAGKIFVPDEAAWLNEWFDEHEKFPAGQHDDQVDATSLAAEAVFVVGVGGLKEPDLLPKTETKAHQVMEMRRSQMGKKFFR